MTDQTPDLRVRSAGAAGAYAFQPLTEAGQKFVESFAATIKGGRWHVGTFWCPDTEASPYVVLKDVELVIVAGMGSDLGRDKSWNGG